MRERLVCAIDAKNVWNYMQQRSAGTITCNFIVELTGSQNWLYLDTRSKLKVSQVNKIPITSQLDNKAVGDHE